MLTTNTTKIFLNFLVNSISNELTRTIISLEGKKYFHLNPKILLTYVNPCTHVSDYYVWCENQLNKHPNANNKQQLAIIRKTLIYLW